MIINNKTREKKSFRFSSLLALVLFINQFLFISFANAMSIPDFSNITIFGSSNGDGYQYTNDLESAIGIETYLRSHSEFEQIDTEHQQYQKSDYVDHEFLEGYSTISAFKESIKGATAGGEAQSTPVIVNGVTTVVTNYPILEHKMVGDEYINTRLVQIQIESKLGRNLITSASQPRYTSEKDQYNALLENTKSISESMHTMRYGKPYYASLGSASLDMIWPELREINGESVIVPIVHLTAATINEYKIKGNTTEFHDNALFKSVDIDGVEISLGRGAFLKAISDITLKNSSVNSTGAMQLISGGTLSLLSSQVNGDGDVKIAGQSIHAETILHRYDFGNETGTRYGKITKINSEGNVILRSYGDLNFYGVVVNAGDTISIAADGNIEIAGKEVQSSYAGREGRWNVERSSVDYLTSTLLADDAISIIANGSIEIEGSQIISDNGQIQLLAGLGITIIDNLAQEQSNANSKFGNTKKQTSAYKTVAIRSVLDAGKGIRIHTEYGDITLRATDISSDTGASVTAANGEISLLISKQTDHYSYTSQTQRLFTNSTRDRGHKFETAAVPTFVGGVKIDAAKGINIQYEGNPDLTFDEQIAVLSGMEGLTYLSEMRDRNDVDWEQVNLVYDEWSKSTTTLSPAAIAVITIAIAVATSGAGAGFAGATGALGAASSAAFTSLVTTAAISLGNGNSIGATLAALSSDENLKSLAITMVTASAMAQIDASFFEVPAKGDLSSLYSDPNNLSLSGQAVQSVTHATAKASIQSIFNGGDFSEILVQSLAQDANAKLGEFMANEIKAQWDVPGAAGYQTAMRYIAHAGAGCILGGVSAEIDGSTARSNGCSAGGAGAVTGELIGDIHKSATEVGQDAEKLEAFLAEQGLMDPTQLTTEQRAAFLKLDVQATAQQLTEFHQQGVDLARMGAALGAYISGADAASIDIAAMTGQNAAENNALFLIPVAIFLLKAIDLALTASELNDLHNDIEAARAEGDEKGDAKVKALLLGYFGDSVEGAVIDKLVEKLIPGGTTFKKMLGIMQEQNVISASTVIKLTDKLEDQKKLLADFNSKDGAVPSAKGNIGCNKGKANACDIPARNNDEVLKQNEVAKIQQDLKDEIELNGANSPEANRLGKLVGDKNEELTDIMLKGRGLKSIATPAQLKVNGNQGFDHVYEGVDENGDTFLMIVDSKQLKNGGAKLSATTNKGVQLSKEWITKTADALPDSSPAKARIKQALLDGNIRTAVAGQDKYLQKFSIINITFGDL
jgi:filamentous hemagglutinin